MDAYTKEEQQIEVIRQWFLNIAKPACISVIIGVSSFYGWCYLQAEQEVSREQASEVYTQVVIALGAGDAKAEQKASSFISEHDGEIYASLVSLHLAKSFIKENKLVEAGKQLRAVQSEKNEILTPIATMRLARVEIELNNLDIALQELDKITVESWTAQVEELRGDIKRQKGDNATARSAYLASIAAASNPVVQMKLHNLSQ
ncbi:YfgM family protein [Candidatus Enterovibrio escicola]|uniref:YfgM family protein n=1 Tax=Candidatus Enterovibrio escicola TaxID=1927127 RepID=UPI00123802D4|nr:tetratricopeptide repeat protein [Candidatus Enterovibrio escacola]